MLTKPAIASVIAVKGIPQIEHVIAVVALHIEREVCVHTKTQLHIHDKIKVV